MSMLDPGPNPRQPHPRPTVARAHLLRVLSAQLDAMMPGDSRPLDVVDLGGGTGGLALDVARLGHRVTVVDPSPDALASLERRTADAELSGTLDGRQGDAADLVDLIGADTVDLVICHRVLEVLDSPSAALVAAATVLRPGGALSLLAGQKHALVLAQALAGQPGAARRTWADPRRLDYAGLQAMLEQAGFELLAADGIGTLSEVVSEAVVERDRTAAADLSALEDAISQDPTFRALAPQVHLFGRIPVRR